MGHQQILNRLAVASESFGLPSVVYTFEPHPIRILNPSKNLKLIFNYDQRIKLLERYSPDAALIAEFSVELAKTPAEQFVRRFLVEKFGVKKIIVGYDFSFGKGGDGTAEHLRSLGVEMDFEVEQVPAVLYEQRPISSSRIRRLIRAGELGMVHQMLGRPFFLVGSVVKGKRRGGSLLGFPTANLSTQQESIPAKGVYAAVVKVSQETFGAAVNIGINPTFENEGLSIEAHILDFDRDIYGSEMEVHFIRRLRDERKFDSIDRLKDQMHKDIDKASKLVADFDMESLDK